MDFLAEAADQLARARDDNEARAAILPSLIAGKVPPAEVEAARVRVNERRMEITWACLAGAAIERGLPPCCRHQRPAPETEETP